jgi:hypothetical protein
MHEARQIHLLRCSQPDLAADLYWYVWVWYRWPQEHSDWPRQRLYRR